MEQLDVCRRVRRLGVIMEPDAAGPREVEGMRNPAAVRGTSNQLYGLPRTVTTGHCSRIGLPRVRRDRNCALQSGESARIQGRTGRLMAVRGVIGPSRSSRGQDHPITLRPKIATLPAEHAE